MLSTTLEAPRGLVDHVRRNTPYHAKPGLHKFNNPKPVEAQVSAYKKFVHQLLKLAIRGIVIMALRGL